MNRRNFIKSTCINCASSIGAIWLLQACSSQKYITGVSNNQKKLTVKKSDFTIIKKDKTIQQKFILVKSENLQFPIVLYAIKDDNYKALYLQCSHQGCELSAYETTMVCPCHGAEFDTNGDVTQGPAENPLQSFVTTQDDEYIYIQL